jgi:adenine-specific DNA-methyltransferase
VDPTALRVTGPFEVLSLGRYSLEDWKGYVATGGGEGRLEDYVATIARLYRKGASLQESGGIIHAVEEWEGGALGISVGPISGRVTARQIHDAARDAAASGLSEVHVLGWAFEANVGEVKRQLEDKLGVKVQLVMIRPDSLAEGLKVTRPEALFSPLALPEIDVVEAGNGKVMVTLKGVAVFDRKRKATDFKAADSGYVASWCLDEDYDGDCFVDCQMFFDFKKKPAIERTLGIEVDPEEWTLRLTSDPFEPGKYRRVAVKVVDVYGNESTVVEELP